jgi:glyoxylase-like metal-dependent hydrolase (beta-lactamase superfamily II)
MTSVKIGTVEVQPMLDTNLLMDPKQFMPAHADQLLAEYGNQADSRGLFSMSITTFLVRSAGKTYLIDTGLGNRRKPGFPVGKLDMYLQEAGVAPEEIDAVIHTHLHIDHVGWNTVDDEKGGLKFFFPKAQHHIQQKEWDYWVTPEHLAAPGNEHLVQCVEPLTNTGRIVFSDGEVAIDENLVFVPSPGHTPGHVSIGVMSAGEKALIVGDASHHPLQLDHPDWSPIFDVDPVLSVKSRMKLFEEAEADGRTWLAGHWPHPGVGRIVRVEGKRVFQPAQLD